ncbi:hypothetical protein IKE96_03995, partial [bacterium]|nr:hypothetical protein [bacterium]
DEHASDKTFNLTFSGLRQIKDTKLKDNSKENPINEDKLSEFNIPYEGNQLDQSFDYKFEGTKIITEDQLKTLFIEKIFNKTYETANEQNGFSTEQNIDNLLENLPFNQSLKEQNLKNPLNNKLTKEDIRLSNYDFFAGAGILSVKVSLNV